MSRARCCGTSSSLKSLHSKFYPHRKLWDQNANFGVISMYVVFKTEERNKNLVGENVEREERYQVGIPEDSSFTVPSVPLVPAG